MPTSPVIGLNADICDVDRWPEGVAVPTPYVDAVVHAGGVPVIVPPISDGGALALLLSRLDGLILTGGWDLDPETYGQEHHPTTRLSHPRRLAGDRLLAEVALAGMLPILGICLGCQLINVSLGGDLVQDIPSQWQGAVSHRPRGTFHALRVAPQSRLAGIVGQEQIEVNSSHHQALNWLGEGLQAVAWAPDGIIEAAEGEGERFLLAVQWHPEQLIDRPEHLALFQALVEAARGNGSWRRCPDEGLRFSARPVHPTVP